MVKEYYDRLLDEKLPLYLETFGAVLIEGPKWSGKTTTASKHAKSILKMQDPSQMKNNMLTADTAPQLLLEGERPRLIDEWQMAPLLWDSVRVAVDESGEAGQFILTGSATPNTESTMHTGTGRIARLLMRPMSLFESLDSTGSVSLKKLFDGEVVEGSRSKLNIRDIAFLICRGGWPQSVGKKEDSALLIADQYVKSVYSQDIHKVDGSTKDPLRVQQFLKSYARNVQTLTNNVTILEDMKPNDLGITAPTLAAYANALQRLFIIEETPAWAPNIRSRTAIRTSHKRGFVDPSIAAAVLSQTPDSLLKDFKLFGFLFEAICIRDLRIYAEQMDGQIYHYRDALGLECDAVIRLKNGDTSLVEVKLGGKAEEVAAADLNKLEKLLITKGFEPPRFKMILTGGEFAYTRKDGVLVVPLGCLKQ